MPGRDPSDRKRPAADWRTSLGDAGPYLGLGMQLGLTVVFFTAAGYGIDWWLGSLPWGTIAGALLGITMLFVQVVRVSGEMTRQADRRRERRPRPKHGDDGGASA